MYLEKISLWISIKFPLEHRAGARPEGYDEWTGGVCAALPVCKAMAFCPKALSQWRNGFLDAASSGIKFRSLLQLDLPS
jgi:hypothetical protein